MNRNLICIICPRGCALTVSMDKNGNTAVSGNSCPKGERYGIDECTHPTRTVTSVVRVSNRDNTMVSVKTQAPIPKESIFEIMDKIRKSAVNAPVKIGDKIIENVFGTDVIATKSIE